MLVDFDALWAALNAETSRPLVKISTKAVYGHLDVGWRVFQNFYLTGGFRRMALNYGITLGSRPEFTRKPGVRDPLIGVVWDGQLSRKWTARFALDGGGFGVGSDVDLSTELRADWRFARHFGLTFGYRALHFQVSEKSRVQTSQVQTFEIRQTLHGPIVGLGIYF